MVYNHVEEGRGEVVIIFCLRVGIQQTDNVCALDVLEQLLVGESVAEMGSNDGVVAAGRPEFVIQPIFVGGAVVLNLPAVGEFVVMVELGNKSVADGLIDGLQCRQHGKVALYRAVGGILAIGILDAGQIDGCGERLSRVAGLLCLGEECLRLLEGGVVRALFHKGVDAFPL